MKAHGVGRRIWVVPAAIVIVVAHVLVPYLFFRVTVSVTVMMVLGLMLAKHAGAAAIVWRARRHLRRRRSDSSGEERPTSTVE